MNNYFQFKQFIVQQDECAMKVCTDVCLYGAWVAGKVHELRIAPNNILDIGTGTGLLSLMMAQKTTSFIDAVETDRKAYEQARQNIAGSAWKDRIQVVHADVKTYVFQKKYDLIVSNPPFYENALLSPRESDNVARHSNLLTLHQLLEVVADNLAEKGCFAVLLPYQRAGYFQALTLHFDFHLHSALFVRHSSKHPYFRTCLLFSRVVQHEPVTEEIDIKTGSDYSDEFARLLKDYYLYL